MAWEDKELSLQKARKLTAQAAAGEGRSDRVSGNVTDRLFDGY